MSKISITKKTAWSLILDINTNTKYKSKENIVEISEQVQKNTFKILYNRKKNCIEDTNISLNEDIDNLFNIFLPIVCFQGKFQYIAHIAQSLDGFIATKSGESKYISGKENLEHIHRLRAVSDIIIVGAKTYLEDKPKLTTRLVKGNSPLIYVFDPKRIVSKKDIMGDIVHLRDNLDVLKKTLHDKEKQTIYIEGGGRTISYFMNKNILNKIHICLCPIILGGGRPSFVPDKYIKLNNQKSFKPNHYQMGNDILFDIDIN
jgi:riboflavin biosynthesis pyrimidine reductase